MNLSPSNVSHLLYNKLRYAIRADRIRVLFVDNGKCNVPCDDIGPTSILPCILWLIVSMEFKETIPPILSVNSALVGDVATVRDWK